MSALPPDGRAAPGGYYVTEYRLRGRKAWRQVFSGFEHSSGHDRARVKLAIQQFGWHDRCEYRIVRYSRVHATKVKP